MKEISFEIEHPSGDTYMGFVLIIDDNGKVSIGRTRNCSHADTDGDYLFDTDNDLIRIQADWFTHPYNYSEMMERFFDTCREDNVEIEWN